MLDPVCVEMSEPVEACVGRVAVPDSYCKLVGKYSVVSVSVAVASIDVGASGTVVTEAEDGDVVDGWKLKVVSSA